MRTVVLVGGLNQDIRSAQEIAALAQRSQRRVLAVNLDFPEGSYKAGALVRRWRSQVDGALQGDCGSPASDMVAIGWSTGGLLLLDALQRGVVCPGTRVMVINPPLHLRWYAGLIHLLTPFAWAHLALPSMAPKRARLRGWTPVTMYRAMLRVRSLIKQQSVPTTIATEGVFLLSRGDELVDVAASATEAGELFPGWAVRFTEPTEGAFAHAPVTQEQLGALVWTTLNDWFFSSAQSQ